MRTLPTTPSFTLKQLLATLVVLLSPWIPSTAYAKKVTLEWNALPGAVSYELKVQGGPKPLAVKTKADETRWEGDLSPGPYTYQIRAFDRLKRPGQWSESTPLVILPSAPKLESPRDGDEIPTFTGSASIELKWQPVPGASQYRLELKRGSQTLVSKTIQSPLFTTASISEGKYSWRVVALIEIPGSGGKNVETEVSKEFDFKVAKKQVDAPGLVAPLGFIAPAPRTEFRWKAVEGADRYEVVIRKPDEKGGITELYRQIHVKETKISVALPSDEAAYTWQVRSIQARAPASLEDPSAVSSGRFSVDRDALFVEGSGYVAFSGMMAPYTYRVFSPTSGGTANDRPVQSMNLTGRLSSEYWFSPYFAIAPAAEATFFQVNGSMFTRMTGEAYLKYRMALSNHRLGWFLAPKVGAEFRQYTQLIPSSDLKQIDSLVPSSIGLGLGIDIRKQFSERWSISGKFSYFFPLNLMGAPDSGSLTSGASLNQRNWSAGLQGFYWLSRRIGLGLGGYYDQRSVSYTRTNYTIPDTIQMDGTYVFGSLIYSFDSGEDAKK